MNIRELQIGNWVYSGEKAQFPMQITGIFQDSKEGTVYLDFEGNEGDVFESEVEDIVPIPITAELLEKNGFRKMGQCIWNYAVEATWEKYIDSNISVALEKYHDDDNMVFGYGSCLWNGVNIKYVHQLQNAMRLCGIEWEMKI